MRVVGNRETYCKSQGEGLRGCWAPTLKILTLLHSILVFSPPPPLAPKPTYDHKKGTQKTLPPRFGPKKNLPSPLYIQLRTLRCVKVYIQLYLGINSIDPVKWIKFWFKICHQILVKTTQKDLYPARVSNLGCQIVHPVKYFETVDN